MAATSALQLISMNPAATNVYDHSTMTITMSMPPHTPTGIAVDIDLPEKKVAGVMAPAAMAPVVMVLAAPEAITVYDLAEAHLAGTKAPVHDSPFQCSFNLPFE
jgi:hypothetical protein